MNIFQVNNIANTALHFHDAASRLGHRSEIFIPAGINRRNSILKMASFPLVRTVDSLRLAYRARAFKAQVVHIHYGFFGCMAVLARLPYILHCHGSDILFDLENPVLGPLTVFSLRRAAWVLVSTPDLLGTARRYNPSAEFLPNPVDTENFCRRHCSSKEEAFRVLSISKLDHQKGYERIIPTLAEIRRRIPASRMDVFGFGNRRTVAERLRREVESAFPSGAINFVGPVRYIDMPSFISSYDLVIGQMGVGAIGMSELEVMACESPLACLFDWSCAYPEPPPFFNSCDPREVARYACEIEASPEKAKRDGKRNREWAVKYHDRMAVTRRLIEIYEKVSVPNAYID